MRYPLHSGTAEQKANVGRPDRLHEGAARRDDRSEIRRRVDRGILINPDQLKRQVEGGTVLGLSMTLLEEVHFDESGVTTDDWRSYPIATMADVPEIKVVLISRPEVGKYGQGSEAANALAASAITELSWMLRAKLRAGFRSSLSMCERS